MNQYLRHITLLLLLIAGMSNIYAQDDWDEEATSSTYLHGIESKLTFDKAMLRDLQTYVRSKGGFPAEDMPKPKVQKNKPETKLAPTAKSKATDGSATKPKTKKTEGASEDSQTEVWSQRCIIFAIALLLLAIYYCYKVLRFNSEDEFEYYHYHDIDKPRTLNSYLRPLIIIIAMLAADIYYYSSLNLYTDHSSGKQVQDIEEVKSSIPGLMKKNFGDESYYGQLDSKGHRSGLGKCSLPNAYTYFGKWDNDRFHGVGRLYWSPTSFTISAFANGNEKGSGVLRNKDELWYGPLRERTKSGYGIKYWSDTQTVELCYYSGMKIQQYKSLPDPEASKGGRTRYMRATYKFGDNIYISLPDDRLSMNEFIWTCMMNLKEAEYNIAVLDSTMYGFPGYRPMKSINSIHLYEQLSTAFTER